MSDADPDARTFARKVKLSLKGVKFLNIMLQAYWGFADHFKDQADVLLNALEPNYRRVLQVQIDYVQVMNCCFVSN